MKANYTLFVLRRLIDKQNIIVYGLFAHLGSSHSRQLALLQSMRMQKKKEEKKKSSTEKQTG